MGGRGSTGASASGNASKSYERMILNGGATARIPYSQYKNEYSGVRQVNGSYDKSTKTIEVKVSAMTRKIMEIVPSSAVREFPSSMSRYQVAAEIASQYQDHINSGGKIWKGAESWQKEVYHMVKAYDSIIKKYGSIQGAIAATKRKK